MMTVCTAKAEISSAMKPLPSAVKNMKDSQKDWETTQH